MPRYKFFSPGGKIFFPPPGKIFSRVYPDGLPKETPRKFFRTPARTRAFGRLIFFQKIHFLRVQKNGLGCGYRDFLAENPAARCPRTLPPRPTAPWDPAPAAIRWVLGAYGTANKEKRDLTHVLFLRTSTICRIFPGCCNMSSISSVVLRCRVCVSGT